ncbi:hypothetical protein SAMN05216573_11363 [Bradyrhizobium sp. Rc3b]|uniref:hypothetical protein n=1 Tax=unclassified Bradyrhizobium TaxID=2631580 RepID=UPI0008E8895D|nr:MULTISPECIES: hypothetical protein [unclassified Bradyrhizobium]MBB4376222.1 hypothetical protein [Bradyrhizobium sp. SBR1B]SFN44085.1 hypothetical protein SAMN05216573_11363 [Bradyrhizobium sp. Rc3b]
MAEDGEQARRQAQPQWPRELTLEAGFAVRRTPPVDHLPSEAHPRPDASRTGKHFPSTRPARELGRRPEPARSREEGDGAVESLESGRSWIPDEDREHLEIEDDVMESYRSTIPAADALLEAPEPEDFLPSPEQMLAINPDKPNGPDYGELRSLIDANHALTEKSREKRRAAQDREGDDAAPKVKIATAETQREYLSRGLGLLKRYMRESDLQLSLEDTDPQQFASWLLGLKPFLSRSTWRLYRASAIAIVQAIPSIYRDSAIAMLNADLKIGNDEGQSGKRNGEEEEVRAARRAKRIDHQHFQQLRKILLVTSRSPAQAWLRDWLRAGIHTGLRPVEWSLTTFERRPDRRFPNGRVWLHVVSAKATDGRATHRTLDLSNFSTEALEAVERMVNQSREWVLAGTWSQRQYDVSKLLRKLCKTLFPRMKKQYTLYSLRHQFIANMKTIYTREEVAAMVGHISLETQVEHYGKRRLAWDSRLITEVPMPVEEQVAQIKKRLELFDLRKIDRATKEAAKRGVDPDDFDGEDFSAGRR